MTVKLEQLPLPGDRVAIAVYNFTDQTGQFKPTEGVQTLSRAVTQGATSILVKALQEAVNHGRSEEHTSELQSLMRSSYAVFCLKKKKTTDQTYTERVSTVAL